VQIGRGRVTAGRGGGQLGRELFSRGKFSSEKAGKPFRPGVSGERAIGKKEQGRQRQRAEAGARREQVPEGSGRLGPSGERRAEAEARKQRRAEAGERRRLGAAPGKQASLSC
jgi:hypothetical protein